MCDDAKKYSGVYPTNLEVVGHLKQEPIKDRNTTVIVPGRNAIKVNILINDSFYLKEDIKKELEQLFEQILTYYDN